MVIEPVRRDDGGEPLLLWRWPRPVGVVSSASVGGGIGVVGWIVSVQVPPTYARTDLAVHAGEVARRHRLPGRGVALFTAVDLARVRRRVVGGVAVDATVGIRDAGWAADDPAHTPAGPGTINVVAQLPVRLDPGAAVNAVATATEAKVQALGAAGVDGTGTPTDAVAVVWALDGPRVPFAGPRSPWGSRLARAVYEAVLDGALDR